jgi:hypothetical protein
VREPLFGAQLPILAVESCRACDMRLRCLNCRNAACFSSVQVWTDEMKGRHYRVLDALFVARGNRGWRRRSSRCLASVRGTASSGDNLAPRRADLSTTRADVLLRGWSGQDFPQACANLPTAYECEVADTLASYSNQSISLTAVMALTELRDSTEPKSAVNADSITRERVHE